MKIIFTVFLLFFAFKSYSQELTKKIMIEKYLNYNIEDFIKRNEINYEHLNKEYEDSLAERNCYWIYFNQYDTSEFVYPKENHLHFRLQFGIMTAQLDLIEEKIEEKILNKQNVFVYRYKGYNLYLSTSNMCNIELFKSIEGMEIWDKNVQKEIKSNIQELRFNFRPFQESFMYVFYGLGVEKRKFYNLKLGRDSFEYEDYKIELMFDKDY